LIRESQIADLRPVRHTERLTGPINPILAKLPTP